MYLFNLYLRSVTLAALLLLSEPTHLVPLAKKTRERHFDSYGVEGIFTLSSDLLA